tara:strand:- start:79 stop:699 length:621 start_codon:yes stop_codon:yes gene_type:complete
MEKEKIQESDDNNIKSSNEDETFTDSDNSDKKNIKLNLEEKNKELEEKVIRLYAEMENQRRRYEKEKDEAFNYGGFSLAKEALNLLDNLERSKNSLENDEDLKNNKAIEKVLSHIDIIYQDMISIFKKNDITLIEAIGKKLDPNLHQAMVEIEDDTKEAGTVVQEIQKGFLLKDRLLRPSLVGVAKKTTKKDTKKDNNDEKGKKTQ